MICIGRIVKPQGLKGEVKIQISTDNLAVFDNIDYFIVGISKAKIQTIRVLGEFAYVKFVGIDDVSQAEMLRGKDVFVYRKDFVLPQGRFLIEDVIDSDIFDENNNFVGKLVDVEQYGATDVWVVYADGREYSVPYLTTIFTQVLPQQKIVKVCKKEFDANKVC